MLTKHTQVVGSFVQGTPTTIAYTFSANYLGLQILKFNMIWVVRTSRRSIKSSLMPPGENCSRRKFYINLIFGLMLIIGRYRPIG